MPITHERLAAILTAAQSFRQSFSILREKIVLLSEQEEITPEQFFIATNDIVLREHLDVQHQVLIEVELRQLNKNAAKNLKEKMRQRFKRHQEATKIPPSAHSLEDLPARSLEDLIAKISLELDNEAKL